MLRYYCRHPKDGEGNVFSLSTTGGGGGGLGTASRSHNISTDPMSFLGGTPSWSHNSSTGPMSFPGGVPQWLVPGPFMEGTPVPSGGYPCQVRMGYPPASTGVTPPLLGPDQDGVRDAK